MKTTILNMAIWAFQRWVNAYIASGLFQRVEQLFHDLADPQYRKLSGVTKRERLTAAIEAEFGHISAASGAAARGAIELLYLRSNI